ncbi:CaiB/BaiF CoA-transferase family protein [Sediminicoccus sp. KRV36]|uniref:CaiB/BaiF CoA transferase family protein n=1 Tax=Sediminicoccus sp. KRV36 TaxID=3133721 RepID=UPI0020107921|nr:CaiB/BaiF CoA-transferase family protein [Sediminicoccus rosea]UPY38875.1 CoA transferase [Sediminicoccus rosea]
MSDARPFAGLRVIDTTHVLAGPFAAYQLAVLGADVIKVESPEEPDQARMQGSDRRLSEARMGTAFLTQASNKRAITLNLKTPGGVAAMRRLAAGADVFLENYRPGAFEALGLGYEALSALNPRLIYCSISAFGHGGPRGEQTGYDNILQAMSGMMAMTGTEQSAPLKCGAPVVDYATGTSGAFAIAAALFQRERTGQGQHIDLAMLDVALTLSGSHITAHGWNGAHPEPHGNSFPFATIGCYQAEDAPFMVAASNLRQQRRLWLALGRPEMVKRTNSERLDAHAAEATTLAAIIATRKADDWEAFLQSHRVPCGRIRRMAETLADPHLATRAVLHRHAPAPGLDRAFTVPVAPFRLRHGGASVETAPREVGADTEAVLRELGYSDAEIAGLRASGAT